MAKGRVQALNRKRGEEKGRCKPLRRPRLLFSKVMKKMYNRGGVEKIEDPG